MDRGIRMGKDRLRAVIIGMVMCLALGTLGMTPVAGQESVMAKITGDNMSPTGATILPADFTVQWYQY